MNKRKCICLIVLVCYLVTLLLIVGRYILGTQSEKTEELEWLLSGSYEETTEQHRGNLNENYQILDDYILYLEEVEYFQGDSDVGSRLYKVDRKSKEKTKLRENVIHFLEQNNELYYSRYSGSSNIELCVLNMLTGETKEILGKKACVQRILAIESHRILYLNYDEYIMECKLDGTKKKKYMKYPVMTQPFTAVKGKETLFFSESGHANLVSLKDKTIDTYMDVRYYSDNVMVYSGDKLYIAVQAYTMKGWSEKEPAKSKWNGLWEIDMTSLYRKRKISDEVPKKLYWRDGSLYDENFDKIVLE